MEASKMASIEKRSENTYRITVSDGYDSDGKKIRKRKIVELQPGLTKKQIEAELKRQAILFEEEVKNGNYIDAGKMTFADFIDRWLVDYGEKELAPKTLERYRGLIDRIKPALGHIQLQKLQPTHLIEFYANLKEKGIRADPTYVGKADELKKIMGERELTDIKLAEETGLEIRTIRKVLCGKSIKHTSAIAVSKALKVKVDKVFQINGDLAPLSDQTVKHHHRLISSILTTAVQWQLIINNPASRVKPPKVEKKEAECFDENTTEQMLELLEQEPLKYKTMIFVTVYTGCRLGELAGLEWCDINFDEKLIRIKQASQYLPGKGTFTKTTKNESSVRDISMPEILCNILKEYKAWWNQQKLLHGDLWDKESDRLFVQWNGKPIHPSTPTKWFKTFRVRNNLPELKFHGLRHTNASLLISNNVDVQTVAKRLGHSKATTTTTIYSHFLRKPDREAAEKLDNLFNSKKGKKEIEKRA
jgi:integrase